MILHWVGHIVYKNGKERNFDTRTPPCLLSALLCSQLLYVVLRAPSQGLLKLVS